MASFWESKYQNAEKSILFIQEAHAEVLKGLHEEIETLQKQCAEFALKLSISSTSEIDKEEYEKKFKSFNHEYKAKDLLISEQRRIIDEKTKSIKALQDRVKTFEKKLENENLNKDQIISQLKQKLELQSNQLAQLTYQLHQTKKNNNKSSTNSTTNTNTNTITTTTNNNTIPNSNAIAEQLLLNTSIDSSSTRQTTTTTSKISINLKLNNNDDDALNENENENYNNLVHVPVPPSFPKSQVIKSNRIRANNHSRTTKEDATTKSNSDRRNSLAFKSPSPIIAIAPKDSLDLILNSNNNDNNESNFVVADQAANIKSRRSSTSSSISLAVNSEIPTPPLLFTQKVLPPVIKRPLDSKMPDPKPFLLSAAASTLHTRAKKDLLGRKALVSLPPIKPFEVNHLVVDSPFKTTCGNNSLIGTSANTNNHHNNNASN